MLVFYKLNHSLNFVLIVLKLFFLNLTNIYQILVMFFSQRYAYFVILDANLPLKNKKGRKTALNAFY